jgi:hypothetical protein
MVYAMIHPEGSKGGRGKKNLEDSSMFSNKKAPTGPRSSAASREVRRSKVKAKSC